MPPHHGLVRRRGHGRCEGVCTAVRGVAPLQRLCVQPKQLPKLCALPSLAQCIFIGTFHWYQLLLLEARLGAPRAAVSYRESRMHRAPHKPQNVTTAMGACSMSRWRVSARQGVEARHGCEESGRALWVQNRGLRSESTLG